MRVWSFRFRIAAAVTVTLLVYTIYHFGFNNRRDILNKRETDAANDQKLAAVEEEKKAATKVVYLKTHKTASTTLMNILMRYSIEKDMAWTHCRNLDKLDSYKYPFNNSWVQSQPWYEMFSEQGFNILASHMQWNREQAEKVMGKDAVYFTLLRDPVDQFNSMYHFAHFEKTFGSLTKFVQKYVKNNQTIRPLFVVKKHTTIWRVMNNQWWDLGRDASKLLSVEEVREEIAAVEKEFDLVLITNDMEPSLVLLADCLQWPLESFTSLKQRLRKKNKALSNETRELLKEWLWKDVMLYEHFKQVLERKKEEYGLQKLEEKVRVLRSWNEDAERKCEKMDAQCRNLKLVPRVFWKKQKEKQLEWVREWKQKSGRTL